jgi:malonate transporter
MFDILSITAPIYVAIVLGYGLTRWGVFQKSDMRGFGTFVIKVSLPAMLFNALSNTQVKEIFQPTYLAVGTCGNATERLSPVTANARNACPLI